MKYPLLIISKNITKNKQKCKKRLIFLGYFTLVASSESAFPVFIFFDNRDGERTDNIMRTTDHNWVVQSNDTHNFTFGASFGLT